MMRSLAAAAALVPVAAQARPVCVENCRYQAAKLAASMKEMFGGDWNVTLQSDFVLISRDKSSRQSR